MVKQPFEQTSDCPAEMNFRLQIRDQVENTPMENSDSQKVAPSDRQHQQEIYKKYTILVVYEDSLI